MRKISVAAVAAFQTALAVISVLYFTAVPMSAQTPKDVEYTEVEASSLTLAGKLFPDTPNPYHRVDTVKYKGFTAKENRQVRESSGISVCFRTNSSTIGVQTDFADFGRAENSNGITSHGYDLYIRQGKQWIWAGDGASSLGNTGKRVILIKDMDRSMKECLLYLPLYSEENSIKIAVEKGSVIEASRNPFKHRIGIWGSSYTHGSSTSRPGMAYPAQLGRMTGLGFLSLGCSGNSKLQDYFANALKDADVEAYVFDAFSNPSAPMIRERLFPFIETIQAAKPDIPLIFMKTPRRETRNFSLRTEAYEQAKMDMADSLMRIAVRKYPNVFWIDRTNASLDSHDSFVDGVHPGDYGYTLWAKSVCREILDILGQYGIYAPLDKEAKLNAGMKFTEASDLNIIGKVLDNTPNPYHRVDTMVYKGFTKGENNQIRCSTGLAVLFRTNSRSISVKTRWGWQYNAVNTMPLAYRGYDLYIRGDKGEWIWAGAAASKPEQGDLTVNLVSDMDGTMHECLMYLPNYSEIYSCKVGVDKDAVIESIESPFRHRIAIFGSSYTHGVSTARAGMSYPMQFMRHTGLQILSLGCSGNSKLQPYFATVLENVNADAFIFDSFSNPDAGMIRERLVPFIDKMVAAHPGKPMIFQQTIYRERRNFNTLHDKTEQAKMDMAAKIFKEEILGKPQYKDVYFITPNASLPSHETSVDGVHPNDYGYYLWARSIEKPILKILSKYGIK